MDLSETIRPAALAVDTAEDVAAGSAKPQSKFCADKPDGTPCGNGGICVAGECVYPESTVALPNCCGEVPY